MREIFSPSKELERGVTRREACAQWAPLPAGSERPAVGGFTEDRARLVPETTIKPNPAATLSGTASERVPSGHFRPQAESEREVGLEASTGHDVVPCAPTESPGQRRRWAEKDPQGYLLNDRKLVLDGTAYYNGTTKQQ